MATRTYHILVSILVSSAQLNYTSTYTYCREHVPPQIKDHLWAVQETFGKGFTPGSKLSTVNICFQYVMMYQITYIYSDAAKVLTPQ